MTLQEAIREVRDLSGIPEEQLLRDWNEKKCQSMDWHFDTETVEDRLGELVTYFYVEIIPEGDGFRVRSRKETWR
jgi:hypothetical protein